MSEKITIAFKSVLNCLLLTNYLKSWPFYFQDLRVDSQSTENLTQIVLGVAGNMPEIVLTL